MEVNIFYFTILIVALFWLYKKFSGSEDDVKTQNIAHTKPWPIVGNVLPIILQRQGFSDFVEETYEKFSDQK